MLIEVTEVYVSQHRESPHRLRKAIYPEAAFHKVVAWEQSEAKGKIVFGDATEQLILESPEDLVARAKAPSMDPKVIQGLMDMVLGAMFKPAPMSAEERTDTCKRSECKYLGDADVCRACQNFDHYRRKE